MLNLEIALVGLLSLVVLGALLYGRWRCSFGINLVAAEWRSLAIATAFYAVLTGWHLGSRDPYQTNWSATAPGQSVRIELARPSHLQAILYQAGINNAKYHWQLTTSNSPAPWQVSDPVPSRGYPAHFSWQRLELNDIKESVTSVQLIVDQPELALDQIILLDINNQPVTAQKLTASPPANSALLNGLPARQLTSAADYSYATSTIFDEIYYATTAYQYWHGLNPYVSVHPPLAMLLMGTVSALVGMSPLSWRLVPWLFGVALLPLIYLFARQLFASQRVAWIAYWLLACDGMHYTLSRMAFLDGIVTFFVVAEYYFLAIYWRLRHPQRPAAPAYTALAWSGLCLGLAAACKWSALFSLLPVVASLAYVEIWRLRQLGLTSFARFLLASFAYLALAGLIYCTSYLLPAASAKPAELFSYIGHNQLDMFNFHAYGLASASHPYASNWYSWPWLINPISIYYQPSRIIANQAAAIAIIGNPLIYWLLLPAGAYALIRYAINRQLAPAVLTFILFLAQYLPYASAKHIMFLYYFYTSLPFAILTLAAVLADLMCYRASCCWQRIGLVYLGLIGLCFALFFPVLAGIPIPRSYVTSCLLWLPSWNF